MTEPPREGALGSRWYGIPFTWAWRRTAQVGRVVGAVPAADMVGPGLPAGDRCPRQPAAAGLRLGLCQGAGREETFLL